MDIQQRVVNGFDGLRLHTLYAPLADAPHAPTILWVHGAFEHSARFLPQFDWFAQHGFASISYDQRGHGRSAGARMYVRTADEYVQDLTAVANAYAEQVKGPLFVLGHSMGGLVVIRHRQTQAKRTRIPVQAALVTSPFLGISAPIPGWKKSLSKLVVGLYPRLAVPNDLDASHISHDPQEVAAYKADPMVTKKATAGWFEAMLSAHEQALREADRTHGPLHFFVAADDRLVSAAATEELYRVLPETVQRSICRYPEAYHEILNEAQPLRDQVRNDILRCLQGHLS
jgi:lysophospholipase